MLALINKTIHSIGRSTMSVSDLISALKKNQCSIAAITDVHSISGVPEFLLECEKAGIYGIAGLTLNIVDGDAFCGELSVLCKGNDGYQALLALLDETGHVASEQTFNASHGVQLASLLGGQFKELFAHTIALDGHFGSIGHYLSRKCADRSPEGLSNEYRNLGSDLCRLRSQFELGDYFAVNEPGRANPLAQPLTLDINKQNTENIIPTLIETTLWLGHDMSSLVSAQQLFYSYAQEWFKQFPEGAALPYIKKLYQGRSAAYPVPAVTDHPYYLAGDALIRKLPVPTKAFSNRPLCAKLPMDDERDLETLVNEKWLKFSSRLPAHKVAAYRAAVDYELSVIKKSGFEDYILNIAHIKKLADSLPGNGVMMRGSAVGSRVLFLLGLSPIDPEANGLMFERFMSEHRLEEPDADLEFVSSAQVKWALRQETLNPNNPNNLSFCFITDYQGKANAFQLLHDAYEAIVEFQPDITESHKKAFQRALNVLTSFAYRQGKLNDYAKKSSYDDEYDKSISPLLTKMPNFPELHYLAEVASSLRNAATATKISAASAVIIPDGVALHFNLIPGSFKETDTSKRIPFTKNALKATGHIKYDILNNYGFTRVQKMLSSLSLPSTFGAEYKSNTIEFVFRQNAFLGVYQLNAYSGEKLANSMRPRNFDEMTSLFALIRDAGKTNQDVIEKYLQHRDNPDAYVLPDALSGILKETHGALLYEEQLLRILMDVGGYSFKDADAFRSALKKGKGHVIDDYEASFISHAKTKFNVTDEEASQWYQPLRDKRGRFVFSKAHAVAYAHVAVQQCFLKYNYPATYAAELCLDSTFEVRGKSVELLAVINDWERLFTKVPASEEQPALYYPMKQNFYDFIDHVATVFIRERANPFSMYKINNPGDFRAQVEQLIPHLVNSCIVPRSGWSTEAELKEQILSHFDVKMQSLPERNRSASSPRQAKSDQSASTHTNKPHVQKNNNENIQGVEIDLSEVNNTPFNPEDDLRNKQDLNWFKDVMIGNFLVYLARLGLVENLSVDTTKSNKDDHYRFIMRVQQEGDNYGKPVQYHIAAPSLDPSRSASRATESKLSIGCFQGGERHKMGFNLVILATVMAHDGVLPKGPIIQSIPHQNQKEEWKPINKLVLRYLYQMLKKNDIPLLNNNVITNSSAANQLEPPLQTILPARDMARNAFQSFPKSIFDEGRKISSDLIRPYFASGALDFGHVFGNPYETKPQGKFKRIERAAIMAQFRKIDGKTPIHSLPYPKLGEFSSGGHQTLYWQNVKDKPGQKKIGRPDHATNKVRGHFFGEPMKKSTTLWMSEGIFDSLGFNENQIMLRELIKDLPWAEPNCVSIKAVGGAQAFLEHLLGVSIMKLTDVDEQGNKTNRFDFYLNPRKTEFSELTLRDKEIIQGFFKGYVTHWVNDPEQHDSNQKFATLLSCADLDESDIKQRVIHHTLSNRGLVEHVRQLTKSYLQSNDHALLHGGILDHWMEMNGLSFIEDTSSSTGFSVKRVTEQVPSKTPFSEYSQEDQLKIKQHLSKRFVYLTGADSIGFALDADTAGKNEADMLMAFCRMIDLPFAEFMPACTVMSHPKTGESMDLKDHNDYLKVFKRLYHDQCWDVLHQLAQAYQSSFTSERQELIFRPAPTPPVLNADAELSRHISGRQPK